MALLAKKLSFLPFIGLKAVSPFMATYVSASPAALRRNNANRSSVVVNNNGEDQSSSDEDEVVNVTVNEDQNTVFADDDNEDFLQSMPCRVTSPTRRPWATSQDENAVKFRMDMPGIAKENVKVYIDNTRLVVRARYSQLNEEALDEDHVLADNVGLYTAEIVLPENVQQDKIRSEMKDGMLLVTAPKDVKLIPVD